MIPDPFALFGLAPDFSIDADALQRAYLAAQQATHPDRLPATASTAERRAAMQRSMEVNEAYRILKSPRARAQALLRMRNILVGTEKDTHKPSNALLMEVMEWRERLEETTHVPAVSEQIEFLQAEAAACESRLGQVLAQAEWEAAAQDVLRLQYLDKTLSDAKSKRRGLTRRASSA